jgi:hypothetical protein
VVNHAVLTWSRLSSFEYTLTDPAEQDRAIRAFQERILNPASAAETNCPPACWGTWPCLVLHLAGQNSPFRSAL